MTTVMPLAGRSPSSAPALDLPSEKIAAFLQTGHPPTPFVVVDLDLIEQRYTTLRAGVPDATVYYAVKANPARSVLERLHALGSSFDVASPAEIDACRNIGVPAERISYGNTIKKRRDIAYAASVGVHKFTVDSIEELTKVADAAPGSQVCVRLFHDCGGADWPLSRKFGCSAPEVAHLLTVATEAGLGCGVSFHVGSQQRNLSTWDDTLSVVSEVFAVARAAGAKPTFLNLGGGLPGTYREPTPHLDAYGAAVSGALHRWFPDGLDEVMIEPGRYMVADAGVLRTEVVLVSRRSFDDDRRWVYVDCGKFHGLAETMDEAIQYRLRTPHEEGPTGPVVLAGPTCDSADVLYESSGYRLPLALGEGDMIDILSTGAYTTTYSSTGFNGFPPLRDYYI